MKPICTVPDCQRPVMAKGWCSAHYYRLRPAPPCSVAGCEKPAKTKGMCDQHHSRLVRHGDPLAGRVERGATQRWIADNADFNSDECLIWPFARASHGYGVTSFGGRHALAHRVMCEKVHGPAPTRQHEAAHSCGKGHEGCVNPKHLRWATKSENALDAMGHGTKHTMLKGEGHKLAKLTEDDVRSIRRRRASGVSNVALSQEYRVNTSCISNVTTRKTWAHVE